MAETKLRFNLDGLEDMRKQMGGKYVARVGFIGQKGAETASSGINMATLALIHVFGSVSRNIPPRDCLLLPIETEKRQVIGAMSSKMARNAFEAGHYEDVFKILGIAGEKAVDDGFSTGGFGQWPALKPATIAAKGSSAILINTGQLRRAVSSDVVKKGNEGG